MLKCFCTKGKAYTSIYMDCGCSLCILFAICSNPRLVTNFFISSVPQALVWTNSLLLYTLGLGCSNCHMIESEQNISEKKIIKMFTERINYFVLFTSTYMLITLL